MKNKFLFFVMLALMAISLCVFASAVELEADELTDITDAIENADEQETVTVNMIADILIPSTSSAIKLEKNVTLVINCNGYTLFANPGSGKEATVYGILLNSGYAKLIINGESRVDAMSYTTPSDEKLTVSNGVITDPNDANGVKSPDFASNGPGILLKSGAVELNNVYFRQYNSGEWAILCQPNANADKLITNFSATNTIIRQPDGCSYGALGTRGGSYSIYESCLQLENSVIYGIKDRYWSASKGSYVKNSRFMGMSITLDGYVRSSYDKGVSRSAPVVFENVIFEHPTLNVSSGTAHINLIDCEFPNGMKINISSDGNGPGSITITRTATCTEAGKQVYVDKNTSTALTSIDEFPNVVEEYAINNPAIGHIRAGDFLTVSYKDGFSSAGYYDFNCSTCQAQYTELKPTAPVIFTALGYSYKIQGTGIVGGFSVNDSALKSYERVTGDKISFGLVAFNPEFATGDSFFINGELAVKNKAIHVEMESVGYSSFKCQITGFSENMELDLVITAYAYSNENELEFIQKQYTEQEASASVEVFEKADGSLYSITASSVMSADSDYIAPAREEDE